MIFVAVLLKKHGKTNKKEEYPIKNVSAVPNEAYGLACHDHSQSAHRSIHSPSTKKKKNQCNKRSLALHPPPHVRMREALLRIRIPSNNIL